MKTKSRFVLQALSLASNLRGHTEANPLLEATLASVKNTDEKTEEKNPDEKETSQSTEEKPTSLADVVARASGKKAVTKSVADPNANLDPEDIPKDSKGIAGKFKNFDAKIKALEVELVAAKKEAAEAKAAQSSAVPAAVEESDAYKKLKTEHDSALEILEKRSLVDHPAFKQKFTLARNDIIMKKCKPILQEIADDTERARVAQGIDSIRNGIAPGDEFNPTFIKKVSDLLKDVDIDQDLKSELKVHLRTERNLFNEEQGALANWRATREELGSAVDETRVKAAKAGVDAFEGLVTTMTTSNPGRKEFLVKAKLDRAYAEMVESKRPAIKQELDKSGKLGVITPALIELIHLGHEAPFMNHVNEQLKGLLVELSTKNAELQKKLDGIKQSSPNSGSRDGGKQEGDDGKPKTLLESVRTLATKQS